MKCDSPTRATLLQQLLAMRIEEPGASLSFEQALAAEQGWSQTRAAAVAAEYRRFLYLAATSARDATPSRAVDKAWHLHLTYSRHYWDEMCGSMLGQALHHRPGTGGAVESEHYRRQYEDTLALYEATFGTPPPPSIWPRHGAPAHGPGIAPTSFPGILWIGWVALSLFLVAGAGALGGGPALLTAAAIIMVAWLVVRTVAGEEGPGRRDGASGSCGGSGGGWTGDCGDGGSAGCGGGGCGGD